MSRNYGNAAVLGPKQLVTGIAALVSIEPYLARLASPTGKLAMEALAAEINTGAPAPPEGKKFTAALSDMQRGRFGELVHAHANYRILQGSGPGEHLDPEAIIRRAHDLILACSTTLHQPAEASRRECAEILERIATVLALVKFVNEVDRVPMAIESPGDFLAFFTSFAKEIIESTPLDPIAATKSVLLRLVAHLKMPPA